MLLLAAAFTAHSALASEAVTPPPGDLVDGRRYTDAQWVRLPSGNAEGRKLPDGVTVTDAPLHTDRLSVQPARDLLRVVGFVPGMLPTRTGGVAFSDGFATSLYVDGIRWDRAGLLGR